MNSIEKARGLASELLKSDKSGHGMDHVDRVLKLSLKFAKDQPVDIEIVSLIALLHDVDDYKIFGQEAAKDLTNAQKILDTCGINDEKKKQIIEGIKTIGYSKRLQGIKPTTLEGKIVSDADMCDALGIIGLIRGHQYSLTHGGEFFDKNLFPNLNMSAEEYKAQSKETTINHMFEKILKLKDLMLTTPGREEAMRRHDLLVSLLYQFFEESDAPEWSKYLDDYLAKRMTMGYNKNTPTSNQKGENTTYDRRKNTESSRTIRK